MWVFTTKGFLSIVQHKDLPEHFQVKSRVVDPLKHFWPEYEIEVIDWADYRFRITIPKGDVIQTLTEIIELVGYTSFKSACEDDEYHRALVRVWNIMYNFQSRIEARPRRS
jgi:hypothetical protein|tara:strand:- start:105 stop:437 length:333 start_codon:yes stop_codon:yes gene_type:complete